MSKQFKKIEDTDSHIRWDAGVITDSDWPVQFLVTMLYTDEYDSEWAKQGKYHISIDAVAPDAVSTEDITRACDSMGQTQDEFDALIMVWKSVMLAEYGVKATLWQQQGNNQTALLKTAREELTAIRMLFGFYMDRQQNMIGNTGWDFIKGEIGFKKGMLV